MHDDYEARIAEKEKIHKAVVEMKDKKLAAMELELDELMVKPILMVF